jgi:hypothetical protein
MTAHVDPRHSIDRDETSVRLLEKYRRAGRVKKVV